MSTAVLTNRLEMSSVADGALRAATRFWFGVTMIGQLIFAFVIASFYGLTAARGDVHGWSRFITHGYVPGDRMGNLAIIMHVGSAMVLMLSGAVQLVPGVRRRFPVFHRWNGRVYMLTAVTLSVAGLYMTWIRGSVGGLTSHLTSTLNAVLIWVCAGLALRYALARNFTAHRPWALRLFLVTSASWFLRLMFFLYLLLFGQRGFDPATFTGPALTFMSLAQYFLPLAVLEIYLRTKESGAVQRMATAVGLLVLTLGMVVGLFAVGTAIWVPQVKAGFDSRTSIAETLSATISSSGIEQAEKQYRELKASGRGNYNFDEEQLNGLGYRLIQMKKYKDAIRVFQLNVEAFPRSGNVYDSLGEAYMDDGDRAKAVANYRRSLELNPKNRNAVRMLEKMGVH